MIPPSREAGPRIDWATRGTTCVWVSTAVAGSRCLMYDASWHSRVHSYRGIKACEDCLSWVAPGSAGARLYISCVLMSRSS